MTEALPRRVPGSGREFRVRSIRASPWRLLPRVVRPRREWRAALRPAAEIGIIPTDAIEVSGPRGRIGPFQGFGDDGHHLRVIRGHQFVSWSRGLIPHASSGSAVRPGIQKDLDYLTADASASRDRAKIPTPDFGGIEVRGTTSIRHASVGSTEASDGRLARGGRNDRSDIGAIDFGVVGPKRESSGRLDAARTSFHRRSRAESPSPGRPAKLRNPVASRFPNQRRDLSF